MSNPLAQYLSSLAIVATAGLLTLGVCYGFVWVVWKIFSGGKD